MITKVTIQDSKKTPIKYWENIPWLKGLNQIEFKRGLNIIIGPNGSGKSTLLKAIATITHSIQSGISTVTNSSCDAIDCFGEFKDGIQIESNGKPVGFFNPEQRPGLIGGMAGFDEDFYAEGIDSAIYKGSSGEETLAFMGNVCDKLTKTKDVLHKCKNARKTDYVFSNPIKCGNQPTLLLDEPERAVSILLQARLWNALEILAENKFQIIVASHSFLALSRNAHYIETAPQFHNQAKAIILAEMQRISVKP